MTFENILSKVEPIVNFVGKLKKSGETSRQLYWLPDVNIDPENLSSTLIFITS